MPMINRLPLLWLSISIGSYLQCRQHRNTLRMLQGAAKGARSGRLLESCPQPIRPPLSAALLSPSLLVKTAMPQQRAGHASSPESTAQRAPDQPNAIRARRFFAPTRPLGGKGAISRALGESAWATRWRYAPASEGRDGELGASWLNKRTKKRGHERSGEETIILSRGAYIDR